MTGFLRAIAPAAPFATIQDAGRHGWKRFGVSGSGAMDLPALFVANTLVGNRPDTATLEFAHVGGAWDVEADSCRIAVTGGAFSVAVNGTALGCYESHTVTRGQRIEIGGARDAVWGYLAVAHGFDMPAQLGSRATHLRSGLGGFNGRRLAEGDELPLRAERAPEGRERRAPLPRCAPKPFRIVLGPQDDFFTPEAIENFLSSDFRVTHQGDRMGYWLAGPPLAHAKGYNLISDGLVPGCVQVPGVGQPLVLLMDCQTIGGYPKIATIITADLARFVQCRPGSMVAFESVDIQKAQRLYREFRSSLDTIGMVVQEIVEPPRQAFGHRRQGTPSFRPAPG